MLVKSHLKFPVKVSLGTPDKLPGNKAFCVVLCGMIK